MLNPSNDIAVLRDHDTLYRAASPQGCAPLYSAPIALIQAIYDLKPEQARRIVRQRIFTTLPSSESLLGMVKVAAKRITSSLSPDEIQTHLNEDNLKTANLSHIIEIDVHKIWRPEQPKLSAVELFPADSDSTHTNRTDEEWMKIAISLSAQVDRRGPRYASDRPIGAILVSAQNKLLAAAINTNARNRTLHAEINLIASLSDAKIPPHAKIYTTLKPCKMCAGMIVDSAQDIQSLKVIFSENDPGPHARNTALDRCSHDVQSQLLGS